MRREHAQSNPDEKSKSRNYQHHRAKMIYISVQVRQGVKRNLKGRRKDIPVRQGAKKHAVGDTADGHHHYPTVGMLPRFVYKFEYPPCSSAGI
jgi:hypothetical protein